MTALYRLAELFKRSVSADMLPITAMIILIWRFCRDFPFPSLSLLKEQCGEQLTQLESRSEETGLYEFRIKDTDIGMSKEFAERIFNPFERERNSTVSKIQGTGLGMSIAKNIIDIMGGTIEVHTEQDKGTEFIIRLEMRLQNDIKHDLKIQSLEGLKALVVDDDFDTCDSVSRMLLRVGMRSEWTLSGKEAVLRTKQAIAIDDAFRA